MSSFVADAVQAAPGQEERRGRLYVSKLGTRFEFTVKKQKVIQIIQPSKGLFRLLFPETKTYFEKKTISSPRVLSGRPKAPCEPTPKMKCRKTGLVVLDGLSLETWIIKPSDTKGETSVWWDPVRRMYIRQHFPDGSKMHALKSGTKLFEGRTVEIWKMTVSLANGSRHFSYMLFAPDLGFPVMEQGSKGLVKELHNVKQHPEDAGLYEIPDGYTRLPSPK